MAAARASEPQPNSRTETLDFRGFDSSRIAILRGGILRPIGISLEMLSQAILGGMILVGRLGVKAAAELVWDPLLGTRLRESFL